jgi:hypothetical protein
VGGVRAIDRFFPALRTAKRLQKARAISIAYFAGFFLKL